MITGDESMLTTYERQVLYIAAMKEGVEDFCERIGITLKDFQKLVQGAYHPLAEAIVREHWDEVLCVLEGRTLRKVVKKR